MATNDTLEEQLERLHISQTGFPACYPQFNPVDTYRIHLATTLSRMAGLEANDIYPLIQRTQTLNHGDLVLPVPALRIKGENPDVLAARWAEQVCDFEIP